ncbi:hypothetical protein O3P69_015844 [Scylla paramamosain]|uniref:Uncharacterized protein n=1 Tax=Scylla paramamosain TaxID=85552 RepID=A0AAW0T9Q4_SCYPA
MVGWAGRGGGGQERAGWDGKRLEGMWKRERGCGRDGREQGRAGEWENGRKEGDCRNLSAARTYFNLLFGKVEQP